MNTTYGLGRALLLNRDGVAVRFEDRTRTFAELADRVARLAGTLQGLGVRRGERVAVLSLNQDRYIEIFLGVASVRNGLPNAERSRKTPPLSVPPTNPRRRAS